MRIAASLVFARCFIVSQAARRGRQRRSEGCCRGKQPLAPLLAAPRRQSAPAPTPMRSASGGWWKSTLPADLDSASNISSSLISQRQGSRDDLRRRSVAANTPAVLKALADECTTGIFFPIGKHLDLLSGNPETGRCGRPYHRLPHLVARHAHQQEADGRPAQGRNRTGHERGEMGAG